MFDINALMGKIKEAQSNMQKTQEELKNITETAESGGGMVKATVNGAKKVVSIELDDSLLNVEDKKLVEDLTVAAVNLALDKMDVIVKEKMQSNIMDGMPNIPGFDLSNLKF